MAHGSGLSGVVEEARKWLSAAALSNEQLSKVADSISGYQEQALALTREGVRAVRTSVAHMEQATSEQLVEAQAALATAETQYRAYERVFFDQLKSGVYWAQDHRVASSAIGVTALALTLRGPRKYLYRVTVGRFQPLEAQIESAERRVEGLKQTVEVLKNDTQKLQERAQMAEVEFLSGRSKLRATGAEMRRLLSSVRSATEQSSSLKQQLRDLPTRDSIRLRAELATAAREAKQQLQQLDSKMASLARSGIYV